jgi:hypothetical protein
MEQRTHSSDLDKFVDVLLRCTDQLMLIVDHMARTAQRTGANGAPPDQVLRGLLAEVLASEIDEAELAAASSALETADEVIGRELFLVPIPDECEPPRAPERHRRRRRRR